MYSPLPSVLKPGLEACQAVRNERYMWRPEWKVHWLTRCFTNLLEVVPEHLWKGVREHLGLVLCSVRQLFLIGLRDHLFDHRLRSGALIVNEARNTKLP